MDNKIHIKKFIYLNKRFLDKDDDLLIYNDLEVNTPYDIYLNGSIYRKQVSMQPDIPITIFNEELDIGYNELVIDNVVFGVTKGYDNESNIIKLNNCNMDESNIYTRGISSIDISKGDLVDMNSVLKIHDILGDTPKFKNISPDLLGDEKLPYNSVIGNIKTINNKTNSINEYTYFRIEFDILNNSELMYFKCMDINGDYILSSSNKISIFDHNFIGDIPDTLLYSDMDEEFVVIDKSKNIGYIEFISLNELYGFDILSNNIKEFRVYGMKNVNDEYNLIFLTNNINNNSKYRINFKTSYISSFKIGDDIYTIGNDSEPMINSGVTSFDDTLSNLPPMSDDKILSILQDTPIDNIILYKNVLDLEIKTDTIKYGITGMIDGQYINNRGILVPNLFVHDLNDIDLSLFPVDSTISYYIESEYPAIFNINKYPTVSYYINNTISLDKYDITPDFIHDEYTILKIISNNKYELKAYLDIVINNNISDSMIFKSGNPIQKAYNYGSNHINIGENIFSIKIEDTLGYEYISENIILLFNNNGPSMVLELNDFYITGRISDSDGDNTRHTIFINNELSSFNNNYRKVPYSFKYEWDNNLYEVDSTIDIRIIAEDIYGGSSTSTLRSKIISKGIIFMDRFNTDITTQTGEQIQDINLGTIISNNPPDSPFILKIRNSTGYDLNNVSIYKNINVSDPLEAIIEMGLVEVGKPVEYKNDILSIPIFKENDIKTISYRINGINVDGGAQENSNMSLSVSANIR